MSIRSATDRFIKDCNHLDQDNGLGQTPDGDDEDRVDAEDRADDEDRAGAGPIETRNKAKNVDNSENDSELEPGDLYDEEEDYGYNYVLDKDWDDSDGPPDDADNALGPDDGKGETVEVNDLGFVLF